MTALFACLFVVLGVRRRAGSEQTIRERDPFSTNASLTPLLPHPPTRTLPQAHGDDLFGMIFFVLSG